MTPALALVFGAALILLAGCAHARHRLMVAPSSARKTLGTEVVQDVPRWMRDNRLPRRARPGAVLFATSGCTACHTYLGSGVRNVGARDLSAVGQTHGVRFFQQYVANPPRFANNTMPAFASLRRNRLHKIAVFLAASKGRR